jgi:hypothetical protein
VAKGIAMTSVTVVVVSAGEVGDVGVTGEVVVVVAAAVVVRAAAGG